MPRSIVLCPSSLTHKCHSKCSQLSDLNGILTRIIWALSWVGNPSQIAITGKDFCLVTADTRMSNGFQIVSRDISKVTKLTKECVIASSGMRADVDTLHKHLKAYIFNYIAKFGREPSTAALSQLLSTTLYYRRFFPFYAFNLLCGLNKKGEGVIYGYDAIGSFDEITYGAQGSGQQLLMSVLDNQFKGHNNLNPEKLEDP